MAGVSWRGGEMTRMTVIEEKEIAKGTRFAGRFSPNELVELSFLDTRFVLCIVADLDTGGATGSVLEKTITSRSSTSFP
jgi:hypothetical protein